MTRTRQPDVLVQSMTMRRNGGAARLLWALPIMGLWLPNRVLAEEFFVATTGSDDAAGTEASPFATVERAEAQASPGDTVYIRGGAYRFSGTRRTVGVAFTKSGQPDRPIRYFAYPGEVPVFDLSEVAPQARVTGLDIRSNWIHLRGLEVTRVRQLIVGDSWGVRARGDHNVLEGLNVHHCEAPGVFITSGSDNRVLNCDSHHNYDPLEDGENADGFGCHSTGGNNVLRGCRAYENSDDGFDFINSPGTCLVEHSWAFRNGYVPETNRPSGNGAGFKSGGFGYPPRIPATGVPRHVVRFSVAFDNRAQGFYANHHPGGLDFIHNTAFDNPANFDMRVTGGVSTHLLRNNLAVPAGVPITNFTGGSDEFNSWSLSVDPTKDDFRSMDKSQATAPREPDFSLPKVPLARLKDESNLVDRGEDQDLPFAGSAPDLGAFETGLPEDAREGDTNQDDDTPNVDERPPSPEAPEPAQQEPSEQETPGPDEAMPPATPEPDPDPTSTQASSGTEGASLDPKQTTDPKRGDLPAWAGSGPEELDQPTAGTRSINAAQATSPHASGPAASDCGCRMARPSTHHPMAPLLACGAYLLLHRRRPR